MAKWVEFVELPVPPGRKTREWVVKNSQYRSRLGYVRWDTGWRRYVLQPFHGTVWEQDCLRDVAAFVEEQTRLHKAARATV